MATTQDLRATHRVDDMTSHKYVWEAEGFRSHFGTGTLNLDDGVTSDLEHFVRPEEEGACEQQSHGLCFFYDLYASVHNCR
jgi:hypothetical protein